MISWTDLIASALRAPRETTAWYFVQIKEEQQWRRLARFDDAGPATVFATLLTGAGFEARAVCGGSKR